MNADEYPAWRSNLRYQLRWLRERGLKVKVHLGKREAALVVNRYEESPLPHDPTGEWTFMGLPVVRTTVATETTITLEEPDED